MAKHVFVSKFGAVGNGKTNDRAAIQKAIDTVFSQGGGTVELDAGMVFLTAGIVLRSNITLQFGKNAMLLQSPNREDYVKPVGDGYEPYLPVYGHNYSETIKWSHNWYHNYPFIYAIEGSHDFAIRGEGKIHMMEVTDENAIIKVCPIGFFRCHHFEICDIHIENYHGYAMMPFYSRNALFRNIRISDWSYGNGDGICLMNSQHIRVTECHFDTGDDSLYVFSSCMDPRKGEWWNSDEPQPSIDIEVDHNDFRSHHCKAFGFILWGLNCPDQEKVEVRNVYVHHNHIETLGIWLWNPYTDRAGFPPVTNVRFEDNVIDGIESNFFDTEISDMTGFRNTEVMHNGGFADGRCFWNWTGETEVIRAKEHPYGRIGAGASLFQGLFFHKDRQCLLKAEVKGAGVRLFVRNSDTGCTVATQEIACDDWADVRFAFSVPEDGNYRIGLESVGEGTGCIRDVKVGSDDAAPDYQKLIFDNGKMIFQYNDNLFKR